MRNEYALKGVGYFKHWSDAYPTMAIARKAAKQLIEGTLNEVHILKRAPLPPGHEIGARWDVIALVSESKTNMANFANTSKA